MKGNVNVMFPLSGSGGGGGGGVDPSTLEKLANKVTSISASSTDTQYPSAKCVYDAIDDAVGDVETLLASL